MLRVTDVEQGASGVVLAVDGWVAGEDVQALRETGESWLARRKRMVVDLAGVRSIDLSGIALLRAWCGMRAELRNGSVFVSTLLAAHGLPVAGPCGAPASSGT